MPAIISTQHHSERLPDWIDRVLQPGGLVVVQDLLNRALEPVVGTDDALVQNIVRQCAKAYPASHGDPDDALTRVAQLMWELGDRHARRHRSQRELDVSFQRVHHACLRGLHFVLRPGTTVEQRRCLQKSLDRYLKLLHHHAVLGWQRRNILTLQQDLDHTLTSAAPPSAPEQLAILQACYGLTDCAPYKAVVAVSGSIGERLAAAPAALATDHSSEVLVPATYSLPEIHRAVGGQCVVGPVVPLHRIAESANIAHRGAEALRGSATSDERRAVPYEDLAHAIVLDTTSPLTDLLVSKHLERLSRLSLRRRLAVGELLLEWLLRGVPISQLARDLNIAKQTAHDRMSSIRNLFGEALDDPQHRFEIIVALRCSLPRWREEAATAR